MRRYFRTIIKVLGLAILIPVLLLAFAAADFAWRMRSTFDPAEEPGLAVVFTGQFARTHAGLDLLEAGKVQRLLISGVNPRAGMNVGTFSNQFNLSKMLNSALDDGRLSLGEQADNTLENALETRCWVAHMPASKPVVLITSSWHLPRASIALERALIRHKVERYGVSDGLPSRDFILDEFTKYLAMRVIGYWWMITGKPDFKC